MLVPTKSLFVSKTFWLGVATLVLSLLEGITSTVDLTGTEYSWVMGILGALIIGLRYYTKQPVTVTGKSVKPVDDDKNLV